MCGGPDRLKPSLSSPQSKPIVNPMDPSSPSAVDSSELTSTLLELAANDDAEAFASIVNRADDDGEPLHPSINVVGLWYGRRGLEHRTPLMVAATYASLSVLRVILSVPTVDVNKSCGPDRWTALHCAASGGSTEAVEAVKLLLLAGADPSLVDSDGNSPGDVISVSPRLPDVKTSLQVLLNGPRVSESPPVSPKATPLSEKREYPIDPRAYSHDWTECPFVHPGENARRRDPRKYHYSCVPCPDFRKGGSCRRGDLCEYAHGVFECWLHPAQYRTRLCKDGVLCSRRVCFFAHTPDELRPLYVSTGSAVPSPRSSTASMEMMMGLLPGSPSSFTPPMSPSAGNGGMGHNWPQPNVPTLHLPGSNLQTSRLRTSLNAWDMPINDFSMIPDLDDDFQSGFASPARIAARAKNLEELFTAEMGSSPRYADQAAAGAEVLALSNQHDCVSSQSRSFQSDVTSWNFGHRFATQFPLAARLAALSQREKLRSLSSRELGSGVTIPSIGSPVNENPVFNWSKWGSSSGKLDWGVNGGEAREEVRQLKRANSFDLSSNTNTTNGGEEPDLSWVNSLVKESPTEINSASPNVAVTAETNGGLSLDGDHWVEQLQLDELVV
ncbi:Zinc finger CCCH domain-containing protein 24 [Acorus calamus]|uniref:Zinc finger CCCH domain-containing protein 24 n=1 Tax=Acorus calamus TaxID=4465 RepID=A0AAV9CJM4_ACOCL|nr:Zinc finger CCCH domain-containing protein 24 [Acorus calamus]